MAGPASASDIQIRRAIPQDAEVCGRIFYEAFATINRDHNFPPELPALEAGIDILGKLFSHPEFYCVVAECGGQISEAIVWTSAPRFPASVP